MFPRTLTVLNGDYNRGTMIPIKDCLYKGGGGLISDAARAVDSY